MYARFLDMPEHTRYDDGVAVCQRIDVHLDRVAQIAVDQHRAVARHLNRELDVIVELLGVLDDFHGAATKHIAWPHQHRIADALGDGQSLLARPAAIGRASCRERVWQYG